jgi:hypothetical protein
MQKDEPDLGWIKGKAYCLLIRVILLCWWGSKVFLCLKATSQGGDMDQNMFELSDETLANVVGGDGYGGGQGGCDNGTGWGSGGSGDGTGWGNGDCGCHHGHPGDPLSLEGLNGLTNLLGGLGLPLGL